MNSRGARKMLTRMCNTKVVFVLHEQVRKRIALISPPLPAWSIYIFVVICFCSELSEQSSLLPQSELCFIPRRGLLRYQNWHCPHDINPHGTVTMQTFQHRSSFNTVSMRISHTFCFEAMDHWPNVAHDSQVSASQLQNDSAAMRNDQATRRAESNDE